MSMQAERGEREAKTEGSERGPEVAEGRGQLAVPRAMRGDRSTHVLRVCHVAQPQEQPSASVETPSPAPLSVRPCSRASRSTRRASRRGKCACVCVGARAYGRGWRGRLRSWVRVQSERGSVDGGSVSARKRGDAQPARAGVCGVSTSALDSATVTATRLESRDLYAQRVPAGQGERARQSFD